MRLPSCLILAGLALVGFMGQVYADFVIHLRDGQEIVTKQYRISGGQVWYNRFGGEVGIPQGTVALIEDRETGRKLVLNAFYTEQELAALRAQQAEEGRRLQQEAIKTFVPSRPDTEILRMELDEQWAVFSTPLPSLPDYRLVGEVRNNSKRAWRGAAMLIRFYWGDHFMRQRHVSISPGVLSPGEIGTFDTYVPSDIGKDFHGFRRELIFLERQER